MNVANPGYEPTVRARRKRWQKLAMKSYPGQPVGWRGGRLYFLRDRAPVVAINGKKVPGITKSGGDKGEGFDAAEPKGREYGETKIASPKYAPSQPYVMPSSSSWQKQPRSWKCGDCYTDNYASDTECYNNRCGKKAPWLG